MILSRASSNSCRVTTRLPRRAASRAELVDEVHEIGAGEAGRTASNRLQVDVGGEGNLAHVHAQDLLTTDEVGVRDDDLAVETARAQERGVEHVRPVGGRDDDDAFVLLEAVHLDEQLVERLFALVVAAAQPSAAMAPDRIDFVDEDDARRVLLGLLEHVADAAGADADEHLDEIRTGDGEEGDVRFARDGARRQRLAGAGRADEKHAARNAAAELLELLRIAQELDDLLQIFLGLVDARHVLEGDAALRLVEELRLRFAETHRLAGAALHLAGHVNPYAEKQQQRQAVDQQRQQPGIAVRRRPGGDRHVLFIERVDEFRIVRRIGDERAAILIMSRDIRAGDRHVANMAGVHLGQQLAERDVATRRFLGGTLEQSDQGEDEQEDDHPEGEITKVRVHRFPIDSATRSDPPPSIPHLSSPTANAK